MSKKSIFAAALLALLAFIIPIEHKYDKLFRFFSLTLIPEGLTLSSGYEKKIYFYISDIIGLILLTIGLIWHRASLKRFFVHPLWIVFFCALASIIASPFLNYSVAYIRLLQLLTPIALFSFLSVAFQEQERPSVTRIIFTALFIAGLFQTTVGIAQYFKQGPLGLRLLGESNQPAVFFIEEGSRWLFDSFTQRKAATTVMRASGTLPHANVFGGFLVVSILSTYALTLLSEKKKWLIALTLPFQIFALCLSFSRAALFAWIISTVIWLGLIGWNRGLKDRTVRVMLILIALSSALSASLLMNQFLNRGGIVSYNYLAKGSDQIRYFHQNIALKIMKDRPLLGLGFNQFSERAKPYFPENTSPIVSSTAPHNIFLFLGCETGLISLFAFLSFIAMLLYKATKRAITVETATLLSLLMGLLFIGLCDFYLILFQQGKLIFFLTTGLLAMHLQRSKETALNKRPA